MDKKHIMTESFISDKNYSYRDFEQGYYATDEYFLALRDVGFITEKDYSSFREVNERILNTRKRG